MILEAKRALKEWCENAIYGLAATLAALPYDSGDVAPVGPWHIEDDTRGTDASDLVALHRYPDTNGFPALHVVSDTVDTADGQAATYTHDSDVPVVLVLAVKASSPSAATRDLDYALRALHRVVDKLFAADVPEAVTACSRNGVQLQSVSSLGVIRTDTLLDSNVATAQVRALIRCRDTLA